MNSLTIVMVTIIGNRILFNLREEDAKSFNLSESIELANIIFGQGRNGCAHPDPEQGRVRRDIVSLDVDATMGTPDSMVGAAL